MSTRSRFPSPLRLLLLAGCLAAGFALAPAAEARPYPTNRCVSDKLKALGNYCRDTLSAFANPNLTRQAALLNRADIRFDARWKGAENRARFSGSDCSEITPAGDAMQASVDASVAGLVAAINDGLDPDNVAADRRCGGGLMRSVGLYCSQLMREEGRYLLQLDRDPTGASRDARQANARGRLSSGWGRFSNGCGTTATEAGAAGDVDALNALAVADTTISPIVPTATFMEVAHPLPGEDGHRVRYEGTVLTPMCQDSSQYSFFAKRGTENKMLVYYVGGGACWDSLTCGAAVCTQNISFSLAGETEFGSGFADLDNPANPFSDWHVIVVPYCSCDVHWGDEAVDYPPHPLFPGGKHVEHRGHDNARLVEKWVREHFLNPSDIFVTGTSAGAYGATLGGVFLSEVYPAASVAMLADAGNGVITQDFLEENFGNWGAEKNLPDIPGISNVPLVDQSIPSLIEAASAEYPDTRWAHYSAAFDGGQGGQTGFYNIMLNPNDIGVWFDWWNASCAFNANMRQQAFDTAASVSNYRYYIATGSRHGAFGIDRVYTDTTGGVPTLSSWVDEMIVGGPGWTNVEASPFNVIFPGTCSAGSDNPGATCHFDSDCPPNTNPGGSCVGEDPNPGSPVPPFAVSGSDVIVDCP